MFVCLFIDKQEARSSKASSYIGCLGVDLHTYLSTCQKSKPVCACIMTPSPPNLNHANQVSNRSVSSASKQTTPTCKTTNVLCRSGSYQPKFLCVSQHAICVAHTVSHLQPPAQITTKLTIPPLDVHFFWLFFFSTRLVSSHVLFATRLMHAV